MMVKLHDGIVGQSPTEGWSWKEVIPGEWFLLFYHHVYRWDPVQFCDAAMLTLSFRSDDRAYLIASTGNFWWTTDGVRHGFKAKRLLGLIRLETLFRSSNPTRIGWSGLERLVLWFFVIRQLTNGYYLQHDCEHMMSTTCRYSAWHSTNNGHQWHEVEQYVTNCGWAKDRDIDAEVQINCMRKLPREERKPESQH
jgi:hypothetical protein